MACLAVAAVFAVTRAAPPPVVIVPEVPTDDPGGGGSTFLPADFIRYSAGLYTPVLTISGNPAVDAVEKMDKPGNWLFSVEAANTLAGSLPTPAEPRDVIRRDGAATYSFFFCGAGAGVPATSNVDAVYLEGGDTGNLIVSFDVPTTIGATTFDPADLVRFRRTGPLCGNWGLGAPVLAFDASAAGAGVATSCNAIGADRIGGLLVLAFDVPCNLAPSLGPPTYVPGDLVTWDGANFSLFEHLASWPIASLVDALTGQANPGRVPPTLHVDKSLITPGDLTLTWTASCSEGANDYGIYEGTIGTWPSHHSKKCDDLPPLLTEDVTPQLASSYYLVVPQNDLEEGSYGLATSGERAIGAPQCIPLVQTLSSCP
ncbi:MAG TPA: hypothetical protein VFB67_06035 [Candidatus Polarisedimenticolaceae bacterium]|nr:hypothetical protein [Candidatus Polarisedimenticolaceae bacterium]